MSKLMVAAIAAMVAGASLWGWGWAVRRGTRTAALPHALTVAIGLAAVLFLGGILNLAHWVKTGTLDAITVAGLGFTMAGWLKSGRPGPSRPSRATLVALIPVVGAGWFVATWLLPQAVFNVHDDLGKYLAHPFIMLATGTLPPNPLGSMGLETLGGQAFLQAFVAAHWPPVYLGAVDTYFCLLLCLTLAGFAVKPGGWALGALAAELCVLTINPQVVNISAVFSGAALLMAVVLIPALAAAPDRAGPPAPVLGLLYAGIIALKSTYVPFIGLHFLFLAGAGLGLRQLRLRWAWQTVLWTVVFVAPWLLLHSPLYLAPSIPAAPVPPGVDPEPLRLFSAESLGYGASRLHYTGLVLGCLLIAGVVLTAMERGWLRPSPTGLAAVAAGLAAGLTYLMLYVGGGQGLFEPAAAIRYACPVMIAVIPALLRLGEPLMNGRGRFLPFAGAGLGFAVTAAFLPSTVDRVVQVRAQRTPLAYFSRNSPEARTFFVTYNREVFFGSLQAKFASIQALVPAGEPLGAWVAAPFWLDFGRNPILPAESAGLSLRWAQLPPEVKYFLLEYRGPAVRSLGDYSVLLTAPGLADRVFATRNLAFIAEIKRRSDHAEILFNDGEFVLLRFAAP